MLEMADQGALITQAVADFLSTHPTLNVDGIYFPSNQVEQHEDGSAGHNVIIFNKASGVLNTQEKHAIAHVNLWKSDEEGSYFLPEFWAGEQEEGGSSDDYLSHTLQASRNQPALELVRNEITIHRLERIRFKTKDTPVRYISTSSTSVDEKPVGW